MLPKKLEPQKQQHNQLHESHLPAVITGHEKLIEKKEHVVQKSTNQFSLA